MKAVESGCDKEGGAIYPVSDGEGGLVILKPLEEGEVKSEGNCEG